MRPVLLINYTPQNHCIPYMVRTQTALSGFEFSLLRRDVCFASILRSGSDDRTGLLSSTAGFENRWWLLLPRTKTRLFSTMEDYNTSLFVSCKRHVYDVVNRSIQSLVDELLEK